MRRPRSLVSHGQASDLSRKVGQDATEAFYGLHRHDVLERPQYARLQIGVVEGETPKLYGKVPGAHSLVPYGEPTWLSKGFNSPYYKEVCACLTFRI